MMKYRLITVLLLITVAGYLKDALAQTATTVQTPAQVQAKSELEAAARTYRHGNFAEAQVHSERALTLDPENKLAPYFIARSIHAQYKPGDAGSANLQKAREAIAAYQRILSRSPGDEESYKAIAHLYGALKEHESLRDWVLRRAADTSVDSEKRAEAYIMLASKDWDCCFKITEPPSNKITRVVGKRVLVTYQMPKERADFDEATVCAQRGLDMVGMALALSAENQSAWSYKANILLELAKLAEMAGDDQRRLSLRAESERALQQVVKLDKATRKPPTDRP